jgi:hypothetical protein
VKKVLYYLDKQFCLVPSERRAKQYRQGIEAMSLFWRNGYDGTSVCMEMGINQFSIYASLEVNRVFS